MKTLYATFEDKHGKVKTVKARFEDDIAKLLEGASEDVKNIYIVEEYLAEISKGKKHGGISR